ncbi:hypothetical protein A2U01_0042947, partial [Trifolium medium]|nr:hypothetical protein [Trifolium medium]
ASVSDLKVLDRGMRNWNMGWRRNLFVWEENLLNELLSMINDVVLSNEDDEWGWGPENGGAFTVNSTYCFLDSMTDVDYPLDLIGSVGEWYYRNWLLDARCVNRWWKPLYIFLCIVHLLRRFGTTSLTG